MSHTLIIDGNFFVFSRLHVLPKSKPIPGLPKTKFMSSEKDRETFMRKLSIDFASEMRKLNGLVDRIVFVLDSKSWRKDFFPEANYKGTREYSDDIDWDGVYKVSGDFSDILKKQGVAISKVSGAEGDDLVFAWTVHENTNERNVIIWSGDKDLKQLVNYNRSSNSYSIWYDNTHTRISGYPGFENWLNTKEEETVDIFSSGTLSSIDHNKKLIKDFISKNKLNYSEVYCDLFVFEQIMIGQKKDNIKSVITKPAKNGSGKIFNFSPKKAENVIKIFKQRNKRFSVVYLFNDEYKEEICKLISREMKVTGKLKEIKRNLELNTKLVLLHVNTIPEAIQLSMFEDIKNTMFTSILLNNLTNKDKLLEGTIYIDNNKKGNSPSGGAIGLF